MLYLLLLFLWLPALVLIAAFIIREIKKVGYYRSLYNGLPWKKFYRSTELVYCYGNNEKKEDFTWLLKDNRFFFADGYYLSGGWPHPVNAYWLYKFSAWLKKNVNIEYLPEVQPKSAYPFPLKTEQDFPSTFTYDSYLRRYYAGVALRALANKEPLNEALVRDVMEVANKLVAELRFKERTEHKRSSAT